MARRNYRDALQAGGGEGKIADRRFCCLTPPENWNIICWVVLPPFRKSSVLSRVSRPRASSVRIMPDSRREEGWGKLQYIGVWWRGVGGKTMQQNLKGTRKSHLRRGSRLLLEHASTRAQRLLRVAPSHAESVSLCEHVLELGRHAKAHGIPKGKPCWKGEQKRKKMSYGSLLWQPVVSNFSSAVGSALRRRCSFS